MSRILYHMFTVNYIKIGEMEQVPTNSPDVLVQVSALLQYSNPPRHPSNI